MENLPKILAAVCLSAPGIVSAQDWTGPYAGGSISLGAAEMEAFDSDEYTSYGYSRVDGLMTALSGRVGYNFQSGGVVYGPELGLGFAAFDESYDFDFCSPSTVASEITGLATLKGRIGFAIDDVLVYGAVGIAYLEGESTLQCDTSYTDTVEGATALVAGIGAEYLYQDNMSISFEYTAIRGDDEYTSADDDDEDVMGFSTDADLFSIGVNYYFN